MTALESVGNYLYQFGNTTAYTSCDGWTICPYGQKGVNAFAESRTYEAVSGVFDGLGGVARAIGSVGNVASSMGNVTRRLEQAYVLDIAAISMIVLFAAYGLAKVAKPALEVYSEIKGIPEKEKELKEKEDALEKREAALKINAQIAEALSKTLAQLTKVHRSH